MDVKRLLYGSRHDVYAPTSKYRNFAIALKLVLTGFKMRVLITLYALNSVSGWPTNIWPAEDTTRSAFAGHFLASTQSFVMVRITEGDRGTAENNLLHVHLPLPESNHNLYYNHH